MIVTAPFIRSAVPGTGLSETTIWGWAVLATATMTPRWRQLSSSVAWACVIPTTLGMNTESRGATEGVGFRARFATRLVSSRCALRRHLI